MYKMSTEHFKPSEFRCPHCGRVELDPHLPMLLERIRHSAGDKPIHIRSGYRCPTHNREVGGAPHSQHMLGKAADIGPGIVRPKDAHELGAVGVGIAGGWAVHVDVRSGRKVQWYY